MKKSDKKTIDGIIKEIGLINDKMKSLDRASKVNFVYEQMDDEAKEAINSLITHLQMARVRKSQSLLMDQEGVHIPDPEAGIG